MSEARSRTVLRVARALSALLLALGVLGILRTSGQQAEGAPDLTLFVFVVHPVSSAIHLALGVVGVAMAVEPVRARRYLLGLAGVCAVWAVAGVLARGRPNDFLTGDLEVVVLYALIAAVAVAAVRWPEPSPATPAAQ
jgi:Domain of unknown function (DUF4383)